MTDTSPEHAAKRFARLAAVQVIYQVALTQRPAAEVLKEFRDSPGALLQDIGGEADVGAVDQELVSDIVAGVAKNAADIDAMLAGALDARFTPERLEVLLRAILRAGAYELHHHASVPCGVIINDYVDVTHAFFGAKEPGLVNAVLDKLSRNLRAA